MKRERLLLVLFALCLLLTPAVLTIGGKSIVQAADVIQLNFNDQFPPTHMLHLSAKYFADQINKFSTAYSK